MAPLGFSALPLSLSGASSPERDSPPLPTFSGHKRSRDFSGPLLRRAASPLPAALQSEASPPLHHLVDRIRPLGGAASSATEGLTMSRLVDPGLTDLYGIESAPTALDASASYQSLATRAVRILPPLRHEDVAVKTTSFDSPPRGAARAAFQSPPVKAARGPLTTSPADKLIESSRVSVMNLTPSRRTNIVTLAPLSKGSHSVVFFSLKIQPPLVFKAVRHLAEGSLTTQHRNQYEQNLRIRGECQVADIVNDPRKEEVVAQVKIEGVPLSQFVGRFTPQHMSDLKEHLQVFISEYNRDCMLDLQPSNLIASDKGRIVLVDFNEGYEGFDGIHQLRTFFFRIYPEETSPNFDQAIELLTYFRSQSIKAYNDLMGLKECSPIAMAHFRIAMGY